jgi:hypothetical protein
VESGLPTQWLSEVDVPGLESEDYYGYEKLPFVTDKTQAAVFSSNQYSNLISAAVLNGELTPVYAAVRAQALGNSLVQLYPANHLAIDFLNYTINIDGNCLLSISVRGAAVEMGRSPYSSIIPLITIKSFS